MTAGRDAIGQGSSGAQSSGSRRPPIPWSGFDARTGEIVATYEAAGDGATNVAATADAVWIANYGDGTVRRYDLP